jgi:hypothetical protein
MSRLYRYAGFTIRTGNYQSTGLFKVRVSNNPNRHKVLANTDNERIVMFRLPEPMSKERAAIWLAFEAIKGITPVDHAETY